MASFDLKNDIKQLVGVNIQAISSNTTTVGNEIDTQGFESVTFIQAVGARTDGTYTLLIEETNTSGSGYTTVAADFLVGTAASTALSAANGISRIGYVGKKRYVRASIVSTVVTTGATVGTVAVLGSPRHAVVA